MCFATSAVTEVAAIGRDIHTRKVCEVDAGAPSSAPQSQPARSKSFVHTKQKRSAVAVLFFLLEDGALIAFAPAANVQRVRLINGN